MNWHPARTLPKCARAAIALSESVVSCHNHAASDISLGFHQTLSAATGQPAVEVANKIISQDGYILIVEGAVPAQVPLARAISSVPAAKSPGTRRRRTSARCVTMPRTTNHETSDKGPVTCLRPRRPAHRLVQIHSGYPQSVVAKRSSSRIASGCNRHAAPR